jgi:shikimate dehydrogenase
MRRLLAVIGGDVSASLSPLIHGAAAQALGLDLAYIPVNAPTPGDFEGALSALRTLGAIGCNVTIPYKALALERCARSSTTAQEIGAVNTISFASEGWLQGDNTDGPGLLRLLEQLPPGTLNRVQILGSGGAARAAAWALARAGAGSISVTARRGAPAVATLARGQAMGLSRIADATLVVSALPGDHTLARTALDDWVDVRGRPYILDLAYADLSRGSPLVHLARAQGLEAQDGRALLAEQGALALSLWTGGEVARIRQVMRAALHLPEP